MLTYAFVVTEKGSSDIVSKKIESLMGKSLNRLSRVYGEYDLVVEVKALSEGKMNELLDQLNELEGVQTMKTCTVLHKTKMSDQLPKWE